MADQSASFYILFSQKLNKYYIGITTDDIQARILKHNSAYYGSRFTSIANDWELQLVLNCDSYSIARKIELYVKRMKSRKFIEKIINDQKEREILMNVIKST